MQTKEQSYPKTIYLQCEDPEHEGDYSELETTWCSNRINEGDVKYVREDEVTPWRPIEQAPKETHVLIITTSGLIAIAVKLSNGDWYMDGRNSTAERLGYTITHFMPLPSPPKN